MIKLIENLKDLKYVLNISEDWSVLVQNGSTEMAQNYENMRNEKENTLEMVHMITLVWLI